MAFDQIERRTIGAFSADAMGDAQWERSDLRVLVSASPQTKGSFVRRLVQDLAATAGVEVRPIPGRRGNRRRVGKVVCEIKFSMESPARFQQVRPPDNGGGYQYLVGIAAQPDRMVYWVIPADDVAELFANDAITFQHGEDSRWFRAQLDGSDDFAPYRYDRRGFVDQLRVFG